MHSKSILNLLGLLLLSSSVSADLITGQVVDSNGVGVPGVDIDVKNLGSGGDPTPLNDGTDLNGFFSTTIPAGQYLVTFTPPPPPTSTHLIQEVDDVIVVGTTDMGTIELPAGVSLSARVLDPGGFPVANVNINVVNQVSGDALELTGDSSDAFGQFSIAVPENSIELRLKTQGVSGPTLAPLALDLTPVGNTDLGDISLVTGYTVTGHLQTAGGSPLVNTDLDFRDSFTGAKLYTPGDNSDANGNFAVVVQGGTWDVEICPDPALVLVAERIANTLVSADVDLGTTSLQPGVVLTGTIRDWAGAPQPGADVDLEIPLSSTEILLCNDNADGAGNYSVVVPTGTFDLMFSPVGFSQPLGKDVHLGVTISGTMILDGALPACPFASAYGTGLAGTGGVVPVLGSVGGAPRAGNSAWAWDLQSGMGGGIAVLFVSFNSISLPLFGGTLLVDPTPPLFQFPTLLSGAFGVPGAGSATLSTPVPIDPKLVGKTLYAQFGVLDGAAPANVAMSNGLVTTFCD